MQDNVTPADRWHLQWFGHARKAAEMSKDPNTQVGGVLVRGDQLISQGWNGLPRGIADTDERLTNREMKLRLVICAERNALINAGRQGTRTLGTTLYYLATDATGEVWGGPPCIKCTPEVIQFGVARLLTLPPRSRPSKWHADMPECLSWLQEAGVEYIELPHLVPYLARHRAARG